MTSSTLAKAAESAASSAANPLGSAPGYKWLVDDNNVNMAMAPPPPRVVTIDAQPQTVTIDLHRTVLIVVDMQNDFCAKGGWVDHLGLDHTPDRAPIEPLQKLLPVLRNAGVHVIWLNWGNRPDLKNMAPNQLHLYKRRASASVLASRCRAAERACCRRTAGPRPLSTN
ncbi:cysteine hydrolase family protein [Bradyrhizobium tropiciagri]|uniref:cysteine hydrolase family protein n=1 Tax=Bradyrhizobium tropiciagri TaxID=312253 RepID=UPI0024C073DF|nr:cysteine hydrolase family protein [Bradyrhizobium tropiciagri]